MKVPLFASVTMLLITAFWPPAPAGAAELLPVAHWTSEFECLDAAVRGDLIYIAQGADGLQVLDIGDPAKDPQARLATSAYNFFRLTVTGDYAYAGGSGRFHVIDIADPDEPFLATSLELCAAAEVIVRDNLAYVCNGYCGMAIVDIFQPTLPIQVGSYDAPADLIAFDIALSGDRLYMLCSDLGGYPTAVLDISDPYAPTNLSWFYTVAANGLAASGDLAFISEYDGLQSADVSDPEAPLILDSLDDLTTNLVLRAQHVYAAGYAGGLVVVDASDPEALGVVAAAAEGSYGNRVAVDANGLIVLCGREAGLWIYADPLATAVSADLPEAGLPTLTAWPNPANPVVNLQFELSRAGQVKVTICDLQGRLVRTLVSEFRDRGRHATVWRGQDEAGRMVASQVYLAVIETRAGRNTTPINLVR